MALTFASGGTAGDVGWAVYVATPTGCRLALRRLQAYKVGLFRAGDDLVESQPIYRKHELPP